MDAGAIGAIIGGSAVILGSLGGGIKFVWGKIERRFERIEAQLLECRVREEVSIARGARKLTCIELLWGEVVRLSPAEQPNPVLLRVGRIIDELNRPSPPNHTLDELVARLDRK